jgi:hypothetical protein
MVYIMKDNNYESLWKHFIKKSIKLNRKATDLMETFKSQTIMIYAVYIHGTEKIDALMTEWKKTNDDDQVNDMIIELQNTKYGNLIKELIFQEVTLKNVLYMIYICVEIIRKVQYTNDHILIREFLNDNPNLSLIEL